MAALDSIKRKAQTIRSGMTEQANPIRYYNSSLMNELDFLINNADTVMDRVKQQSGYERSRSDRRYVRRG